MKKFLEERTEENRVWMCCQRSGYRKMYRDKKREYNRMEANRLLNVSKKDPKEFWREIKNNKKRMHYRIYIFMNTSRG